MLVLQVRRHLVHDPEQAALVVSITKDIIHDEYKLLHELSSATSKQARLLWAAYMSALAKDTQQSPSNSFRMKFIQELAGALKVYGAAGECLTPLRVYALLLCSDAGKPPQAEGKVLSLSA
jgi:hypothetical protein